MPGRGQPTEKALIEVCEALTKTGLRDAGYVYISPGEIGFVRNNQTGQLQLEFPDHFTGGDLKYFSNYLHTHGFKFSQGISPGALSCTGEVGVCGPNPDGKCAHLAGANCYPLPEHCHAADDARWMAEQGSDHWPCDWCQQICKNNASCYKEHFGRVWDAIQTTGRNMTLGIYIYVRAQSAPARGRLTQKKFVAQGESHPETWAPHIGHCDPSHLTPPRFYKQADLISRFRLPQIGGWART